MRPEAALARFREYMVGPTRFMNLLSCFELGLVDTLRENPGTTAAKLGEAVGATPDAVEQLLNLLVKEGFVGYDEGSGGYSLAGLAGVDKADLDYSLAFLNMVKVVMLRQLFHLTESVRTGTLVGMKEFYGTDEALFVAAEQHEELRASWGRLGELEAAGAYSWFFQSIDIPAGARVLDLLGGTGFGAIMTCQLKSSPGLHVASFDVPEKQAECLRNFEAHGVAEQCSFIGGDVFGEYPTGFDVVLVKHFIDMFDQAEVRGIFERVNRALDVGGQVIILAPVYPEDLTDTNDYHVDFFPGFLLGCATGKGGLQKVSTYQSWLADCGFEVTKVIAKDPADIPPQTIVTRVVLCATKTA